MLSASRREDELWCVVVVCAPSMDRIWIFFIALRNIGNMVLICSRKDEQEARTAHLCIFRVLWRERDGRTFKGKESPLLTVKNSLLFLLYFVCEVISQCVRMVRFLGGFIYMTITVVGVQ